MSEIKSTKANTEKQGKKADMQGRPYGINQQSEGRPGCRAGDHEG